MNKDFVCQEDFGHQIWVGYVADHCVRDVSRLINRLNFLLIYPL